MSDLSAVDTVILIVISFCALLGIYWGIIRQVLSIVGLLAGLALATAHYVEVADLLSSLISEVTIARIVAFALIVVSVNSAASLAASLLRKFVGLLFLGWLDHVLGGVLGAVQGVLICTTMLLVLSSVPNAPWSSAIQESRAAPLLVQSVGSIILALLPTSFQVASRSLFGSP